MRTTYLIALMLMASACRKAGVAQVAGKPESVTFAPELKVDLSKMTKTPSGLYILDIQEGSGAAVTAGQTAQVQYTGWFIDGKQFDSSVGGAPLEFAVGQARVIAGWDEGVAGMKPGGKRRLVVPPDLAYGDAGYPGAIPPGATLVFDVELVGVRP